MNYHAVPTWQLRHCRRVSFLAIFTSGLYPYLSFYSSQPLILPHSTVALIRRLTPLAVPFVYIPQARLQRLTGIYRQRANEREVEVIINSNRKVKHLRTFYVSWWKYVNIYLRHNTMPLLIERIQWPKVILLFLIMLSFCLVSTTKK